MAPDDRGGTPEPGEDRTPRHPLDERDYEGPRGNEHHHTNVWMNRHGEEEGGHRGGSHDASGSSGDARSDPRDGGESRQARGGGSETSGDGESRESRSSGGGGQREGGGGSEEYRAGEDRTPRHPLPERDYEDRHGEEHHHTNVFMNRHDESEGGHRGGSHEGGA